ncbi:MAG: winged helix-turn-helix domain-containing protein, partial [Anaerolinea sp.]|nr:winged helix-turn-helix domain-containing protein [Anaerolinea sp.]
MLNLQLFGAFSAKDQFGREIYFRDNKVRALLAYLALEGSQTQPREKLLELFWGYASQERAQHSLRMALTRLRQSLEQAGLADLLHVTRSTVQLQPEPPRFWVDAVEFEELAAHCRGYGAADGASHALTRAWMRRAVELYRGRLLFGINLNDSPSFEYWLTLAQSRYEQQTLSFLAALAEHALTSQEIDLAEDYARRQLALLPGHERAHRQLMRVFARRGQRQLVWQQYQQCVHELKAELGAEPEAETTALFEQLARGSSFPAASGADTPPDKAAGAPNNLPALFTPFFGRENERSRLIDLLLNPAAPLLTVVGPGGAGKTRLALDSVHHVLHFPAFRDGVWFVPLDGLRAGDQNLHQAMASTIAQALGLELSPQSPPHAQLLTQLKPRKTLLILDNFEQLIAGETDGVDFVLDLVRHLPSLKLLVSSRRPLNLQMETLIALNGLPAPQKADDSAYSYSSVQLFMERGRRVCPACSFEGDNLPAMVEICRILEGMPLALELVAVRLRELNCQQLLQALTTDLDLFKTRWRDLAPRHRSMRAVFDWSWSLLSQEEQRVLSELSLFRGSFTLEAAQAITGADSESVYALIDHSLIRFSEGRYSLHALLRQFAGDQLAAAAPIHRRHSRYFLDFVRQRAQRLIGQELVQAGAEIGQEWENIQQAWLWAVSEHDLSGLASTLDGLGHYLRNSSMIWFGETLFQAALDSLLAAEDSACAGRAAVEADQRARSETGPSGWAAEADQRA